MECCFQTRYLILLRINESIETKLAEKTITIGLQLLTCESSQCKNSARENFYNNSLIRLYRAGVNFGLRLNLAHYLLLFTQYLFFLAYGISLKLKLRTRDQDNTRQKSIIFLETLFIFIFLKSIFAVQYIFI